MKSLIKKKNKKYKSNKFIILLSIAFAAILVATVAIAYFIFVQNHQNISQNGLQNDFQNSLEETSEVPFYTSYKPYKAIEIETEKEVTLATVFGTAYSQYGGELTLNEDNTFSLYVGISNSDDSEGTFTLEDDNIKAVFNSGEEKEFVVAQENEVTVIIVPMGLYNIYFKP